MRSLGTGAHMHAARYAMMCRSEVGLGMWRGGESPVRSGARSRPVKRPSRARPPPSRLPQAAVLTTTRDDQLAQSKLVGKPLAALDQSLGQW